ncbi:hypothetical protein Tco_0390161 [Tanacetum coccineum]
MQLIPMVAAAGPRQGNKVFKGRKYALAKAKYDKFMVVIRDACIFLKILREFNHVNPQDDEEGKEFASTRLQRHQSIESEGNCLLPEDGRLPKVFFYVTYW